MRVCLFVNTIVLYVWEMVSEDAEVLLSHSACIVTDLSEDPISMEVSVRIST